MSRRGACRFECMLPGLEGEQFYEWKMVEGSGVVIALYVQMFVPFSSYFPFLLPQPETNLSCEC